MKHNKVVIKITKCSYGGYNDRIDETFVAKHITSSNIFMK